MNKIKEYRADGWPICPQCEEDELYSLLQWNGEGERPAIAAYIAAGLRCYRCWWATPDIFANDYARMLAKEGLIKPMILVGQTNDNGEVLLFDKWSGEPNRRVRVWRLPNGDVRIEFVDRNIVITDYATLASYLADDLAKALTRTGS